MIIREVIQKEVEVSQALISQSGFLDPIKGMFEDVFQLPFTVLVASLSSMPRSEAISKGHQVLRRTDFQALYYELIRELADHLSIKHVAFQRLPTFRIQCPGEKSVNFHSDDLSSGHPRNIRNIWIPLVSTNMYNTLHYVPCSLSDKIKRRFLKDRLSIEWLDHECRSYARPWLNDSSDLLLFSNKTLHGTIDNLSDEGRISIDFRLTDASIPGEFESSSKNLDDDYCTLVRKPSFTDNPPTSKEAISAVSIVFSAGRAAHLNHPIQRAIINSFAHTHKFSIVREVGEWHCEHYPILDDLCLHHKDKVILLATEMSYTSNSPYFKSILRRLSEHPAGAYFCLENYKI